MSFSFAESFKDYKRRVQSICDYYRVSTLWAVNMSLEEIEWFEKRISQEDSISHCCDRMEHFRKLAKAPISLENYFPYLALGAELDWLEELHLLLYDLPRVDFHLPVYHN